MKANALVMSRSQASIRLLVAAFAELGIEYRIALSGAEAIDILATEHHSALVVDFDLPQAAQVAKAGRSILGKHRPVMFGMMGDSTCIADVFQAGANFVLYKPLDLLQVLHSFRAAQGFMPSDRRNSSRQRSETLAYLQLPSGTCSRAPLRWFTPPAILSGLMNKAEQACSSTKCRRHAGATSKRGLRSIAREAQIPSAHCSNQRSSDARLRLSHIDSATTKRLLSELPAEHND
jgi:CheY-like chemotaxis protein